MHWVALVVILALIEYFVFGALVGRARGTYGVEAPAISGHPVFERYMRAHQNTMEQLVIFLPAIWLFANYVSPGWAALLGLAFVIGRVIYFRGYITEPRRRESGVIISAIAQVVLLLGGAIGVLVAMVR